MRLGAGFMYVFFFVLMYLASLAILMASCVEMCHVVITFHSIGLCEPWYDMELCTW